MILPLSLTVMSDGGMLHVTGDDEGKSKDRQRYKNETHKR